MSKTVKLTLIFHKKIYINDPRIYLTLIVRKSDSAPVLHRQILQSFHIIALFIYFLYNLFIFFIFFNELT